MMIRRWPDHAADLAARHQRRLLFAEREIEPTLEHDGAALQIDNKGEVVIAIGQQLAGSRLAHASAGAGRNQKTGKRMGGEVATKWDIWQRLDIEPRKKPSKHLAPHRDTIALGEIIGR